MYISVLNSCLQKTTNQTTKDNKNKGKNKDNKKTNKQKTKTFDIETIVTPAHYLHDVNPGFDLNTW
jgi:hypothetical protein